MIQDICLDIPRGRVSKIAEMVAMVSFWYKGINLSKYQHANRFDKINTITSVISLLKSVFEQGNIKSTHSTVHEFHQRLNFYVKAKDTNPQQRNATQGCSCQSWIKRESVSQSNWCASMGGTEDIARIGR